MTSLTDTFLQRATDDRPGLTMDGRTIPWSMVVQESGARAEILRHFLDSSHPPRFAVATADLQEHMLWLGSAVLTDTWMTGLDLEHPEYTTMMLQAPPINQFVVTDESGLAHMEAFGARPSRVVDLQARTFLAFCDENSSGSHEPSAPTSKQILFSLMVDHSPSEMFRVNVTSDRVASIASNIVRATEMTHHDVCYHAVPANCANSVLASWGPAVVAGAEIVLQSHFSAETFLADIHEYNCTYFTYTGSMISHILACAQSELDHGHRLRIGFGTRTTLSQRHDFHERFGCELIDADLMRSAPSSTT